MHPHAWDKINSTVLVILILLLLFTKHPSEVVFLKMHQEEASKKISHKIAATWLLLDENFM